MTESISLLIRIRNQFSLKNEWIAIILLPLFILLGTSLRLFQLGTESYWMDEISTVLESQQNFVQIIESGRLDQPPAYYLPFHLWVQHFGTQEFDTRLFSVLAGVISIILIYFIGRELFGHEVGLIGSFFLTISEYQIYFSQQARYYTYFELMALFSFLFFILTLKYKGKINFTFYVLSSILMVYSHTYGVFILIAQNLYFLLRAIKYRELLISWIFGQILIFLAFVPSVYLLLLKDNGVSGAISLNIGTNPASSALDPIRTIYRFILAARRGRDWDLILIDYVVAFGFLISGVLFFIIREGLKRWVNSIKLIFMRDQENGEVMYKLILLGLWLICPIILPFFLSLIVGHLYADRYMISAAPALYLILAYVIIRLRNIIPTFAFLGTMVILMAPGLYSYYATDLNEQWRETASYIQKNLKENDVIVFSPNGIKNIYLNSFNWYYQDKTPRCGIDESIKDEDKVRKVLYQCIQKFSRFWVIMPDSSEMADFYRSSILTSDQNSIQLKNEHRFVGITVYLFDYKEP